MSAATFELPHQPSTLMAVVVLHLLIAAYLLSSQSSAPEPEQPPELITATLIKPEAAPAPVVSKPAPMPPVVKTPPLMQPMTTRTTQPASYQAPVVAPTPVVKETPPTPTPVVVAAPTPVPIPAPVVTPSTPPAPTPAPEPVMEAPRFDAAYLNNPQPAYPLLAQRLGQQGRVLLRVMVGVDGRAKTIEIAESSGTTSLDNAALKTVRDSWRFVPAKRGGEALEAWVKVPINFKL